MIVEVSRLRGSAPYPSAQGCLLHWSMDAACVLEKTRGNENHAYFRENWGEEKLRGEERLNYSSTYLHCLLLFSQKNFLDRYARSITFYFHPPIRGCGTCCKPASPGPRRARPPLHRPIYLELPRPLPQFRSPNMQRDFTNHSYIYSFLYFWCYYSDS